MKMRSKRSKGLMLDYRAADAITVVNLKEWRSMLKKN